MNIENLNNITNRVDTLDNQFSNLDKKFRFFGANLTEQLQRQEERASQGWVIMIMSSKYFRYLYQFILYN